MGNGLSTIVNAVQDVAARKSLLALGLKLDSVDKTLSTLRRNNQAVESFALDSITINAGAGLTGGGDLTTNRTLNVGAGFGISVAADAVAVDQAMVPTWTGIHTFSAQDVHNAGVSLGTSGVLASAVADGAAAIAFDQNDATPRTQGFRRKLRESSIDFEQCTWDGRWSWGYGVNVAPRTGHVMAFIASDAVTPSLAPQYVGILSAVQHANTSETAVNLVGVQGGAVVSTGTGLSADVIYGLGGAGAGATAAAVFNGKVLAGLHGKVQGNSSVSDMEPVIFDRIGGTTGAETVRGNYEHATAVWCDYTAHGGTAPSFPSAANRPSIGSGIRIPIQGLPCGTSAGSPTGEQWGFCGEAPVAGSLSNFPLVTAFGRVPYPRRTGGTGVLATQLWWEPWPNTTTIRDSGTSLFGTGTGTITASSGSAAVSGSGTSFTTELVVGSLITVTSGGGIGQIRRVESITDNTNLVVSTVFNVAVSGATFSYLTRRTRGGVYFDDGTNFLTGLQQCVADSGSGRYVALEYPTGTFTSAGPAAGNGGPISGNRDFTGTVQFTNAPRPITNGGAALGVNGLGWSGLLLKDTAAAFEVTFQSTNTGISADRTLTVDQGDASRTITLSGNPTLNDWFDQDVKTTGTPQHARIGIGQAAHGTVLLAVNDATGAPGTTATPAFAAFYGGLASSGVVALGDPDNWLRVRINATTYKIPVYV